MRRVPPRRFHFEPLEDRRLLAGDLLNSALVPEGEGGQEDIAVHLSAMDVYGVPVDSVEVGERFLLQVSVEDTRPNPPGVFAAYVDIEFDGSRASTFGPVIPAANFQNGVSGEMDTPGLIDEAGGFGTSLVPTGAAVSELFTVMVAAESVGQLTFHSYAADIIRPHALLLYGIDTTITSNSVAFGEVTIDVTPAVGDTDIDAVDDSFDVTEGTMNNRLSVLGNDAGFGDLVVTSIESEGLSGRLSIAPDGHALLYTPATNFVGTEQFSYTARDQDGGQDTAIVTVNVKPSNSNSELAVAIRLEATDLSGQPISSISRGSGFLLNAFVDDTRSAALGVFAAYFDLLYASDLVEAAGSVDFGVDFVNGMSSDFGVAGIVDEVGAFQQSIRPLGQGESRLFTIPFVALESGQAMFQSDPADDLPVHGILVYGENELVGPQRVSYGGIALEIVADLTAVDDSYRLPQDVTSTLDVLANDVHKSGDLLSIRNVDATALQGAVSIAADRQSLTYTPAPGFSGTEQFTYFVEGQRGVSSAQVTVHTEGPPNGDDVVAIELTTTDVNGATIGSIEAGQEFWVTATVDDLRSAGVDDLGVFAAYLDLLYDADLVSVVKSNANALGFDVTFGTEFGNGQKGNSAVPGIIDEIGAFQTSAQPLGTAPRTLFSARFQAKSVAGADDQFTVQEDAQSVDLDVLANDARNSGSTTFRSDPADIVPGSDVLLYEPTDVVEIERIRFGAAELQIVGSGRNAMITDVGRPSNGGSVVISADGQRLQYTPAPNFFGVETFTYTVDGGDEFDVEVIVEPVADAPVANGDLFYARANHELTIGSSDGPLANDGDADGDPLEMVNVSDPSHGTLMVMDDGSLFYTPTPEFVGVDRFTYQAFDGALASSVVTVEINVEPPPVQIRMEVVDASGSPQSHVAAGATVYLQAFVKDRREDAAKNYGVGAAYLDVDYDPRFVTPVVAQSGEFDIEIEFGDRYQNGRHVESDVPGLLDEVGAFQSGLTPLGSGEFELFTVPFELASVQAVDDQFTVSGDSRVNPLDVLANELGVTWDIRFDASSADESPLHDVVLFDPPVALSEQDISFVDASVTVGNGTDLTIANAGIGVDGRTEQGGSVMVARDGTSVEYVPPQGFTGTDTFAYTVVDANGATGTATVQVEVVMSWQNQRNHYDVNSDGLVTSTDVLVLINELNRNGARQLPPEYLGPHFFDVNGDGFLSPQDVLTVLNYINDQSNFRQGAEGESPALIVAASNVPLDTHDWMSDGLVSADADVPPNRPASSPRLASTWTVPVRTKPDRLAPTGWSPPAERLDDGLYSPTTFPQPARRDAAGDEMADDLVTDLDRVHGLDEFVDEVALDWSRRRKV